jgi:mono/diheme cytochrome c family protein
MKTWIRRIGLAVLALVLLAAAALYLGAQLGERKAQRKVPLAAVQPVALPSDAAAIQRGRYLYLSRGCVECHGADGAGRQFIKDDKGFAIKAPNISPGPGNVVAAYTTQDWVRTLRHGVKPDGRPVFVMPSEDYARLTDADVGALIAYVKQMPPAAGGALEASIPMMVKALYGYGALQDAAEKIDHGLPPATPVTEGVTREHGAYVANACIGCHGPGLSGGRIPGAPPSWPEAANLTPGEGSAMKRYANAEQFIAMLKSGRRPDGSEVSPVMPFVSLREISEVDARALYLHLASLPPRASGGR